MNLVPTELNHRLANAVRYSVAADRFYIAGKSGFWRFVGVGFLGLGLGAAVGLGFFGYSYVNQNSDNLNILSSTFSKALSEARLQATAKGTVQLEPHEIFLAKGQTVSFDNNSRVLLDPAAKVLANGELTVQAPSISVPQGSAQKSTPKIPVITNFTVFKRVPFEKGSVWTGWQFLTSVQKYPTSQYCYYTESSEISGADAVIDVGNDRKPVTSGKAPQGMDMSAAFNSCVWFNGENP
jgi:hypothetical protein